MILYTKINLLTRKTVVKILLFRFFISADSSQINEYCQPLHSLDYFNFFQGFLHNFEIHIIRALMSFHFNVFQK